MIEFLLFGILPCLCKPLRELLGAVVLFLVGMWAYGHFLLPPGP